MKMSFIESLTVSFRWNIKVHVFWEGHKILRNLCQLFDWQYIGQIIGGDFAKFCGLLRIYELYLCKCMTGQPLAPIFLKLSTALYEFTKKWTDIFLSNFISIFQKVTKAQLSFLKRGFIIRQKSTDRMQWFQPIDF